MASSEISQWSSFWRQGFITTFGRSKPDNYDGVVREFWREKFLELPAGARLLDIATGNGAIAILAAEIDAERDKGFSIDAADLATINENIFAREELRKLRNRINFHSRTSCEDLPFEDDRFNFVSSQFGFEYGDTGRTIPEIRRVLMTGGQFVAISHHAGSQLIKSASVELEVYDYALDELDLFGKLQKQFDAVGDMSGPRRRVRSKLQHVEPLTQAVNESVASLQEKYPDEECANEIIGAMGYLARGARQATEDERREAVVAATADFSFAQARLRDMVAAALTREDTELLAVTAKEAGFDSTICIAIYGDDRALAGWQIHMQ